MGCCFSKVSCSSSTTRTLYLQSQDIKFTKDAGWANIAWSGGSSNGIVYVGAYKSLYDARIIDSLKGAVGTSIGSLFALLCVLNYNASEFYKDIMALDLTRLADSNWCPLSTMINSWGVCEGKFIQSWVDTLLTKATQKENITFAELHSITNRHLKVVTFNETLVQTEYWDHITQPDTPVALAIRTSCSMPIFYEPVRYRGHIYIDGGVGDVFPLNAFTQTDGSTLGIMVMSSAESITDDLVERQDPTDLGDHAVAVYTCMTTMLFRLQHQGWPDRTIALGGPGKKQWDFAFTQEEKRDYIQKAYNYTAAALFKYDRVGRFN